MWADIGDSQPCHIVLLQNGIISRRQAPPNFQRIGRASLEIAVYFYIPVIGDDLIRDSRCQFEIGLDGIGEHRRTEADGNIGCAITFPHVRICYPECSYPAEHDGCNMWFLKPDLSASAFKASLNFNFYFSVCAAAFYALCFESDRPCGGSVGLNLIWDFCSIVQFNREVRL